MNDCIADYAISRAEIVKYVESYIHEIITESGVDKNEHTNDVLRKIVKGITFDLPPAEPYKGMTNGEVIKAVFPDIPRTLEWHIQNVTDEDWWNSPYEPQESER